MLPKSNLSVLPKRTVFSRLVQPFQLQPRVVRVLTIGSLMETTGNIPCQFFASNVLLDRNIDLVSGDDVTPRVCPRISESFNDAKGQH